MRRILPPVADFIRRFPALAALALAGLALAWVSAHDDANGGIGLVAAYALAYGLSAVARFASGPAPQSRRGAIASTFAALAAFAALALWFRWIGDIRRDSFAIRFMLVAGALLASFAFFLARPGDNGRRLPTAVAPACFAFGTSYVLFGIVALILAALERLFGLDFPESTHTFFFLAATFSLAPSAFVSLASMRGPADFPPKTGRILLDYLFGPAFLALLAILLAYFAKCAAGLRLPNGQVTWLVSSACAIWLALSFAGTHVESRFAAFIKSRAGLALLPLLALQAIAIRIRLSSYGLSPVRYLAIALTLFFAAAVALATFRRGRHLKWAYPVFAAMSLFAALAPRLNAIDASFMAQGARLRRAAMAAGIAPEKAMEESPAEEALDDPGKAALRSARSFLAKLRRSSCGYCVGDLPDRWEPRRTGVNVIYRECLTADSDLRWGQADIAGFSRATMATLNWTGDSAYSATAEKIAQLAAIDPAGTFATVSPYFPPSSGHAEKFSVPLDSLMRHIATPGDKRGAIEIDGGHALLPLWSAGQIMGYRRNPALPFSATNCIPSMIRGDALLLER